MVTDAERKSKSRQAIRDLSIPDPVDPARRERCLADPFEFLSTYAADQFYNEFTPTHREMIAAIVDQARYGGSKCIAAPRGEGKTTITTWLVIYSIFAGLVRFPFVIGSREDKAQGILRNIKAALRRSDLLLEDFPAVCKVVRYVAPAPQRANAVTVEGVECAMVWRSDEIMLPTVAGWPEAAGGCIKTSGILSGGIRGVNVEGVRPDFVILDDVDDRESAESEQQTNQRIRVIDEDVAGLAGQGRRLGAVMLCTCINRRCVAWQYSDPAIKPGWQGSRYKLLAAKPTNEALWDQYTATRIEGMVTGDDPQGREAHQYYVKHREKMDEGAVVSNPNRHITDPAPDGEPLEVSTLEHIYNRIADLTYKGEDGWSKFATEYQNEPPVETLAETLALSSHKIQRRLSGFDVRIVPPNTASLTAFVDVGERELHWAAVAWEHGATGRVIEYGVQDVYVDDSTDKAAIEPAIVKALHSWWSKIQADPWLDQDGVGHLPEIVLVDAGYTASEWKANPVYTFVNEVGYGRFYPSRGASPYKTPRSANTVSGDHWHIGATADAKNQFVAFDADHWKLWVHHRWTTKLGEPGALSIYGDPQHEADAARIYRDHHSFAKHQISERLETVWKDSRRGLVTSWVKKNRNNHWFDCMAGCGVAAEIRGVRLLTPQPMQRPAPADGGRRGSIVYRKQRAR